MASVPWRINAERLMLLAWSRAILLQLAHPLIAAGVADHSTFRGGPSRAAARLHHTVRAMLALTFGDAAERDRTLDAIRAIHRRVRGRLPHAVGQFAAGTSYSAEDPALLLWVHATLIESVLLVYDRIVAPLSAMECDAYCEEAAHVAVALGAREEEVPRTLASLEHYIQSMIGSGTIAVGAQAREVAEAVLAPPLGVATWPARINRIVTLGLLPTAVRQQYGWPWDDRAKRSFRHSLRVIKAARRVLPTRVAWWAAARRRRPQPERQRLTDASG